MSKLRQAVVVIHGMGEQRPMQFLRDFVAAAIPAPDGADKATYYSKPDRMSELFELRRYLAPPSATHPQTELYEYYWAHHMSGNRMGHLLPLLKTLLLRWPWNIAGSLRAMWATLWVLVLGIAFTAWKIGPKLGFSDTRNLLVGVGIHASVATLLVVLIGLMLSWTVGAFGDVARYLNPHPQNVAIRQKIRSEAVSLLRRLQSSGKFHRIIVVGHSLGSFVALDALIHLWIECNHIYAPLGAGDEQTPVQDKLSELEAAAEHLCACEAAGRGLEQAREDYTARQRDLWRELRQYGNPWLVTDFVSVGSPLAHASMLLGSRSDPVRALQERYELPRCPPEWEEKKRHQRGFAYPLPELEPKSKPKPAPLRTLHDAAFFAPTRWTNIWFPAPMGLLGDIFAGPVAPEFGPGVTDRPVTSRRLARYVPVLPHILYFKWPDEAGDPDSAVGALRAALELRSWKWAKAEPASLDD